MNYFLAKTDPETYSISDLERDKKTTWDGVRNPTAVQALKAMQPGDLVYIYHSQGESAIVGLAKVLKNIGADPNDAKSWLVEFGFLKRFSEPYVTLQQIKAIGFFPDFRLVRQSRLSTMVVPEEVVEWLAEQGVGR
jgi:predicted RNA-binding protein with PUA-like domain